MDDYTWHLKLKQKRSRRQHEILALIIIIALILGMGLWNIFYSRTPEYALNQLQTAVKEKDSETFSKYADLNTICKKAYDDLTGDMFASDKSIPAQNRELFQKFYTIIQPQVAEGTKDTILDRIKTGQWPSPGGDSLLKGRQLGIDFEYLLERSQLKNTELLSIGNVIRDGDKATAEINVSDCTTDTAFTLILVMEKSKEGYWRVAYIDNYRAYLDTVEPLQKKDINDYSNATESIVAETNQTLAELQGTFKWLTTYTGDMTDSQKSSINELITKEIIPALQKRQQKLEAIEIPSGAVYVAGLRSQSAGLSISAWENFAKGVMNDDQNAFETAESYHKAALDMDKRIDDIFHHAAISKSAPEIP